MIDQDDIVRSANEVPALPPTSSRFASLLADEDWDIEDVAAIVTRDPVLT